MMRLVPRGAGDRFCAAFLIVVAVVLAAQTLRFVLAPAAPRPVQAEAR